MALTQLQQLELNKRVDKIFHAPSNAPAVGHQPEIAFVTQMSGDRDAIHSSVKDAVASLKAHDKMFQNMRSNMVYWGSSKISSKVTQMSFILMGKALRRKNKAVILWISLRILKISVHISSCIMPDAAVF